MKIHIKPGQRGKIAQRYLLPCYIVYLYVLPFSLPSLFLHLCLLGPLSGEKLSLRSQPSSGYMVPVPCQHSRSPRIVFVRSSWQAPHQVYEWPRTRMSRTQTQVRADSLCLPPMGAPWVSLVLRMLPVLLPSPEMQMSLACRAVKPEVP